MSGHDLSAPFRSAVTSHGLYSSPDNLRFYTSTIFDGIPLSGRSFLDVGGGTGIYTFYAADAGARRAICLEPEVEGATSGVGERFRKVHESMGRPEHVRLERKLLEDFTAPGEPFDVILLNNSVNHLDEEACQMLPGDAAARDRYRRQFARIFALAAPGADLVVTDCSNRNFFSSIGLKNPVMPMIEWRKHQPPEVWATLLGEVGFVRPRIRWTSFNHLRSVGRVFLGNRAASFFLTSHFCLTMKRPLEGSR